MQDTSDPISIFGPLWRRKWLIIGVAVVVGVASYFYYKNKTAVYQANTEIYLGAASEEVAPGERAVKVSSNNLQDQTEVINTIIVEEVHHQLRKEGQTKLATAKIKAKGAEKGEFITITAEAHSPKNAALLVNRTASAYIARTRRQRGHAVERAINLTRRQLTRIEAASLAKLKAEAKDKSAPTPNAASILQETQLNSKINQLESSLTSAGPQQVKAARPAGAKQVSPKPRKDAIFGFVLGLVLAGIAAYALGRFDRRLRTLAAVEAVYGAPILAALPQVRRPIVSEAGGPRPSNVLLESLRRLRVALKLTNGAGAAIEGNGHGSAPRVLMFISAESGEGKSTTVADLALVLRDAGEQVAVVEANFRQPVLARLLQRPDGPGLAEVLEGTVARQSLTGAPVVADPAAGGVAAPPLDARTGTVALLAGSQGVANPPAMLDGHPIEDLLEGLGGEFDRVLVDAPSPLEVSDALALLSRVDGLIILARLGHTGEDAARRLAQLLAETPSAPVLGVVANCVPARELRRYGLPVAGGRRIRL